MGRISNRKKIVKHDPLVESNVVSKKQQYRHGNKQENSDDEDVEKETFINSKQTKKILDMAKEQQEEVYFEETGKHMNEDKNLRIVEEDEDEEEELSEFEEDYL